MSRCWRAGVVRLGVGDLADRNEEPVGSWWLAGALHPRREAPMALNFLPDRLVVVVRAADIVGTFEDFWQCARGRFGAALPRGLCLAAGPSSSADIEMTFATGVHGPVELHALIV